MARLIAQTFDPHRPLTVRRPFTAGGRHYKPGDDFPWRTLRMSVRQTALLFNAGKLIHPAFEPVTPEPVTPEPTIEMEMQDEDVHHIAVTAPAEDEQPAPAVEGDGLDDLNMAQLRAIAEQEGSPTRRSRDEQIEAIRQHRAG